MDPTNTMSPTSPVRGALTYFMGAITVLTCPCHLPILIALLSGTAAGAILSENLGRAFVLLFPVFFLSAIATWRLLDKSENGRSAGSAVYFAALVLSNVALAYDFRKMEAALESLTPETQRMWEQKALAGDALAQNVTGMAYKYGRFGVPQDHAASIKWFRMAAEQGEADAQFNLARIYGKAEGIYRRARAAPQNDAEAFKWYRLSAEQGHTLAQVKLAEMYAEGGSNIPRDLVQAYKWISIAAASGNPTAAKLLTTYAAEMTDQQVKKAESLAQEWRNRHR